MTKDELNIFLESFLEENPLFADFPEALLSMLNLSQEQLDEAMDYRRANRGVKRPVHKRDLTKYDSTAHGSYEKGLIVAEETGTFVWWKIDLQDELDMTLYKSGKVYCVCNKIRYRGDAAKSTRNVNLAIRGFNKDGGLLWYSGVMSKKLKLDEDARWTIDKIFGNLAKNWSEITKFQSSLWN